MASERTRFSATRSDGARSVRVVLLPDEVIVGRQLAAEGYSVRAIAGLIGANYPTVWGAIVGQTWRHLDHYAPPVKRSASSEKVAALNANARYLFVNDNVNLVSSDQLGPVCHILVAEQVLAARPLLRADPQLSYGVVAKSVGATMSTIVSAVQGKTWAHLNSIEPPIPSLRSLRREQRRIRAIERDNHRSEHLRLRDQNRLNKLDARKPKGNRIRAGLAAEIRRLAHDGALDVYEFAHTHRIPIHVIYDVLHGRLWSELNKIVPPVSNR
jgi:hypothetical protein